MKWVINYRDPDRERKEQIKKKSNAILRRLDENERKDGGKGGRLDKLIMSSYEKTILTEVVAPEDIHISFQGTPFLECGEAVELKSRGVAAPVADSWGLLADIGGLEPIIEELRESVIYPLTT